VKVCDFGLSQVRQSGQMLRDPQGKQKGTPLSMAPEVLLNKEFNEKADVYSFGLVLWEFLTRSEPFPEYQDWDPFVKAVTTGERPPLPAGADAELRDLINECWHGDPQVRPTFEEIVRRMDGVILNCAIVDTQGRRFWLSCCDSDKQLLHKLPWDDFCDLFLDFLDEPQYGDTREQEIEINKRTLLNTRCLKALLVVKNDSVTLERFGQLLAWFGPLKNRSPPTALRTSNRNIDSDYDSEDEGDDESDSFLDRMQTFFEDYVFSRRRRSRKGYHPTIL